MVTTSRRVPGWVWGAACLAGGLEPFSHLWLKHGLPANAAFTGFHIGDDPFFLTAMRIFTNGFFSPYATCTSSEGSHSLRFFALPHHWIYGALGLIAATLHVDPFILLGWANGVATACYVLAVYFFLRTALPQRAPLAFVLFLFSGGLGGLLYLFSTLSGLSGAAGFEMWFHRYARYELIEGPFLSPWLVSPRLYYTLPLALGFLALGLIIQRAREGSVRVRPLALLALLALTWVNARLGPLFWAAALCFLSLQGGLSTSARVRALAFYAMPVFLGAAAALLQFRLNPTGGENVSALLRRCVWFGSLLGAGCWSFCAASVSLHAAFATFPRWARCLAGAALAYLAAFAALYFGYQAYWGNLLAGGDTAAAIHCSDWALLGIPLGMLLCLKRPTRRAAAAETNDAAWMGLWLLLFLPLAISAFGQGWFLRFMPERLLAVLGVPLAAVAADGLARLRVRRPRLARAMLGVLVFSGLCSIAVGAACFQGPLGQVPGAGPFQWTHSESMSPIDARLMGRVDAGIVAAPASIPPLMGDVLVQKRPGLRTVFGQPSLEFGGINMRETALELQRFFDPGCDETCRKDFLKRYCVDYVYCPETRPVAAETIRQLEQMGTLRLLASEGRAALFQATHGGAGHE